MNLLQAVTWQYNAAYRPETFDKSLAVAGAPVQAFIKRSPLQTLIVFPGSETKEDWWHDAEAIAPYAHAELGIIPYGFSLGLDDMHATLKKEALQGKLTIIAHSLGCPHALYQAAMLILDGYDPSAISVIGFEPPRSCTHASIDILALIKDMTLTRNSDTQGHSDIVLDQPEWASHPRALTQIGSMPITGNIIIDKAIHAIQAVMVSCELLEAQNGL